MADTLSQDNVQGVLGEFLPILDRSVATFTSNNVQGVFGEFVPALDATAGQGDSDTYFIVSSANPDTLDLYVEGALTARFKKQLLDINAGFAANLVAKTGNHTVTTSDHVITCDASGGAFTVTLPAISGVEGIIFHIKKIDSSGNAVTVDGDSSETIDGETTQIISSQYDNIMLIAGASEWHII